MTVTSLMYPPSEIEGHALVKVARLSLAALAIPDYLEDQLNRADDIGDTLVAIEVMARVDETLTLIDELGPGLIDMQDGGTALFELQCALTKIHVMALTTVRSSRIFIGDLAVLLAGEEILPWAA